MLAEILKNAPLTRTGRKYFTSEEKAIIVSELENSKLSISEFCRSNNLLANTVYHWRKNAKRGATMSIKNNGDLYTRAEIELLRSQNSELKHALAEAEIDKRILKKKLEMDAQKQRFLKQKS